METKCCGTCKWHKHERIEDVGVCVNRESDYCALWAADDHCCDEWEER